MIIQLIDCRKNNFAGRTAANSSLFSPDHIYSLIVVDAKGEGENLKVVIDDLLSHGHSEPSSNS